LNFFIAFEKKKAFKEELFSLFAAEIASLSLEIPVFLLYLPGSPLLNSAHHRSRIYEQLFHIPRAHLQYSIGVHAANW